MANKDLRKIYLEQLEYLLPTIDFPKLDESCNSCDLSYAKDILKRMHDLCVEVYGTEHFDDHTYEMVALPAVIRGSKTRHVGLGIVTLDLESSGEHWETFFLTPKGVIEQGGQNITAAESKYLSTAYIPYEYWYTVPVEGDIHVDFGNVPWRAADFISHCYIDQSEMEKNGRQTDAPNSSQQNGPAMS